MVRFAELVPDMVLDADVITDQGRLLLPAGTTLTAQHLRVMRKWGIEQADVRGVTSEDVSDDVLSRLEPAAAESIAAAVTALFRRSNLEHPAVRELVELTRRRLVEHYVASLPSPDGAVVGTASRPHGA
jgi:hypothetical protein